MEKQTVQRVIGKYSRSRFTKRTYRLRTYKPALNCKNVWVWSLDHTGPEYGKRDFKHYYGQRPEDYDTAGMHGKPLTLEELAQWLPKMPPLPLPA